MITLLNKLKVRFTECIEFITENIDFYFTEEIKRSQNKNCVFYRK